MQFLLHRSLSVPSCLSPRYFSFSPFRGFHNQIHLLHLTVFFHSAFQSESCFPQRVPRLRFNTPRHSPLFCLSSQNSVSASRYAPISLVPFSISLRLPHYTYVNIYISTTTLAQLSRQAQPAPSSCTALL